MHGRAWFSKVRPSFLTATSEASAASLALAQAAWPILSFLSGLVSLPGAASVTPLA